MLLEGYARSVSRPGDGPLECDGTAAFRSRRAVTPSDAPMTVPPDRDENHQRGDPQDARVAGEGRAHRARIDAYAGSHSACVDSSGDSMGHPTREKSLRWC